MDTCDDCPNNRYTKVSSEHPDSNAVQYSAVELKGHNLVCYTGEECCSELRILRAASTHYPVLRSFLHAVNDAIKSHKVTLSFDKALMTGDFVRLMALAQIENLDALFVSDLQPGSDTPEFNFNDSMPGLELQLQTKYAKIIALYEKAVHDYAQHPCCSCQRLCRRRNVTAVKFSDNLGTVWPALKKAPHERGSRSCS